MSLPLQYAVSTEARSTGLIGMACSAVPEGSKISQVATASNILDGTDVDRDKV